MGLTTVEQTGGVTARSLTESLTSGKSDAKGRILEAILLETMFDLPSYEGVEEVVVNAEVVEGRAQPLMIYAERRSDKGGAA